MSLCVFLRGTLKNYFIVLYYIVMLMLRQKKEKVYMGGERERETFGLRIQCCRFAFSNLMY